MPRKLMNKNERNASISSSLAPGARYYMNMYMLYMYMYMYML